MGHEDDQSKSSEVIYKGEKKYLVGDRRGGIRAPNISV